MKLTKNVKKHTSQPAVEAKKSPAPKLAPGRVEAKAAVAAPGAAARRETTTESIASRAYTLWEKDGRPAGRDVEYWLRAESQLKHSHSFAA